jgi:hypothetical protein
LEKLKKPPNDPDYVGPKMQVFSNDMPGKWRQYLMGFTEGWKDILPPRWLWELDDDQLGKEFPSENLKEDKGSKEKFPVFAREEYVRMWLSCDGEVYLARLGEVVMKVGLLFDELEKRETRFVRAGAAKKKVDDMLEYSVR